MQALLICRYPEGHEGVMTIWAWPTVTSSSRVRRAMYADVSDDTMVREAIKVEDGEEEVDERRREFTATARVGGRTGAGDDANDD